LAHRNNETRPDDSSQPRLKVAIDPERPAFWTRAEAGLRLHNTLAVPLLVLDVQLGGADDTPLLRLQRQSLAAELHEAAATLCGRRLADEPGPAARPSSEPRWEWQGEGLLLPLPLLRPGESFVLHGPIHLTDTAGRRLRGQARFVELSADLPLYHLTHHTLAAVAPPPSAAGWVVTDEARLTFQRGALPASATRPPALPDGPALHSQALPEALYHAVLERSRQVSTLLVFEVEPPPLTCDEARKRAGVTAGPYTYFAFERAWAFETRRDTVLVGADDLNRQPGRLVKLIDWLSRSEPVELVLFALAAEPDPEGLASSLRDCGQRVGAVAQKGGGYRLTVEVTQAGLLALVAALEARGLSIEGYGVRAGT
jgi:hypothetical protein